MPRRLTRSITEPIRTGLTWEETWLGPDRGLIWNWERGRLMRDKKPTLEETRDKKPTLAERAFAGELVDLAWKGGTEELDEKKAPAKYGCLPYLAQWQGLRGENLEIALDAETIIECAVRKRSVIFREWLDEDSLREALDAAKQMQASGASWTEMHNALYGPDGVLAKLFPVEEKRAAFWRTSQGRAVWKIVNPDGPMQRTEGSPEIPGSTG